MHVEVHTAFMPHNTGNCMIARSTKFSDQRNCSVLSNVRFFYRGERKISLASGDKLMHQNICVTGLDVRSERRFCAEGHS
jgi:hypothetical protein